MVQQGWCQQPDQRRGVCVLLAALQTVQYNLLPDGDSVPVTASNRLLYIYLLADWHLNARLGRTASAFASKLYGRSMH